jgi:hypothetical protein
MHIIIKQKFFFSPSTGEMHLTNILLKIFTEMLLSRVVMKLMINFHVVSAVTEFIRFLSTFKPSNCCPVLNYREFISLNVLKIMFPIH